MSTVIGNLFVAASEKAALLTLLLLASISLQILNPLVLRHFIDTAVTSGSMLDDSDLLETFWQQAKPNL